MAKGLHEGLSRGHFTPQKLTEYAGRIKNRAILKRMGYLADLTDWLVH